MYLSVVLLFAKTVGDIYMYLSVRDIHVPISGSTSEVGGMFSATSIINTVIDRSVVIPMVPFSPEIYKKKKHP